MSAAVRHGPDAIVAPPWPPPSRRRSPNCPSRACASRPRCRRRRSGARWSRPRASSGATCACPASARARCRRRSSSSAWAARPILDEAVRGTLGPLVPRRHRRRGHPPGRRARPQPRRPARRGRSRSPSPSRSACARPPRWASTAASRSAAASPRPTTRPCRPRSTRCASAARGWTPSTSPPPATTTSSWTSRARLDGDAVRRRLGPRPARRAGLGPPGARLRGAARGREGRRRAHRHDHLPRRLRRREPGAARRPSSP